MEFNKVDATVLNLQPGDILVLTIKSDDIDETTLERFRDSFSSAFTGNKVAIICISPYEDVSFTVTKPTNVNQGELK